MGLSCFARHRSDETIARFSSFKVSLSSLIKTSVVSVHSIENLSFSKDKVLVRKFSFCIRGREDDRQRRLSSASLPSSICIV